MKNDQHSYNFRDTRDGMQKVAYRLAYSQYSPIHQKHDIVY